jgi:hypothetical protein
VTIFCVDAKTPGATLDDPFEKARPRPGLFF